MLFYIFLFRIKIFNNLKIFSGSKYTLCVQGNYLVFWALIFTLKFGGKYGLGHILCHTNVLNTYFRIGNFLSAMIYTSPNIIWSLTFFLTLMLTWIVHVFGWNFNVRYKLTELKKKTEFSFTSEIEIKKDVNFYYTRVRGIKCRYQIMNKFKIIKKTSFIPLYLIA